MKKINMRILIFVVAALFLCGLNRLYAKENPKAIEEAKKTKKAKKTETEISAMPVTTIERVSGTVGAISKNFIAVVYKRDKETGAEEEMALPIAEDFEIEHAKSLHDIKTGDRITVEYEKVVKEGRVISRKAKVITYRGPARKKILEFRKIPLEENPDTWVWEEREKSNVTW